MNPHAIPDHLPSMAMPEAPMPMSTTSQTARVIYARGRKVESVAAARNANWLAVHWKHHRCGDIADVWRYRRDGYMHDARRMAKIEGGAA